MKKGIENNKLFWIGSAFICVILGATSIVSKLLLEKQIIVYIIFSIQVLIIITQGYLLIKLKRTKNKDVKNDN